MDDKKTEQQLLDAEALAGGMGGISPPQEVGASREEEGVRWYTKAIRFVLRNRYFKFLEKIALNVAVWTIIYIFVTIFNLISGFSLEYDFKFHEIEFKEMADKVAFALIGVAVFLLVLFLRWLGRKQDVEKYAEEYVDIVREDFSGFMINFSSVWLVYVYVGRKDFVLLIVPFVIYVLAYLVLPRHEHKQAGN